MTQTKAFFIFYAHSKVALFACFLIISETVVGVFLFVAFINRLCQRVLVCLLQEDVASLEKQVSSLNTSLQEKNTKLLSSQERIKHLEEKIDEV